MPNWCSNVATLGHENQAELVRLAQAFVDKDPMETFMPSPYKDRVPGTAPINDDWGYSWRVENWGTKWDVKCSDAVDNLSEGSLCVWFDSAWGPPIGFYRHLAELGFDVEAFYYECGVNFCGKYCSESDEDICIDITGDSAWVKENIPADINECFAISDYMADWEDEEKEADDGA
jgi:hypothetical protein